MSRSIYVMLLLAVLFVAQNNFAADSKADGARPSLDTVKYKGGLVAHWSFDETGENDVCKDSSGNGFDGTPSKPIKRAPGKIGSCLSITGEQVVNLPLSIPYPAAPMSFSVWVKPQNINGRQYFITFLPSTKETHHEYEFALYLENRGNFKFTSWGKPTPEAPKESWGVMSPDRLKPEDVDKWIHVAATVGMPGGESEVKTVKEGAVNMTWTLYLNGEVVDTRVLPVCPFQKIGNYSIGAKPSHMYSITGDLDELWFFNRVLTAEEVKSLYKDNKVK